MAGDLEDFLRRAAARRQAKASEQGPVAPKPRPEYSNSRTERRVQPHVEALEEVITAEIVEDPNSIVARTRRVEKAKQAAREAQAELKSTKKALSSSSRSGPPKAKDADQDLRETLLDALKSPGGIQQAILLKEIIDRPEHRW